MNKLLIYILLLTSHMSFGQVAIKDADAQNIAFLKENVLYNNSDQAIFNLKAQLVFDALSSKKEAILLSLELKKNKTLVYQKLEDKATWIIKQNEIYWRKNREEVLIVSIEQKDGFTSYYHAQTDSLIAYANSDTLNILMQSLVFYYLWKKFDLENTLKSIETITDSDLPDGVVAYMKPVFGDPLNVWVWDGKILKPAYDNNPFLFWTFDDDILKPDWNSKMENEWSWDGEELKPYWGGHPRNNWRWEGNILRQIFENNYKNEFEIVDNIARKRFGSYGDIEWEIHGEMPLPLVSIVLLGIVYRR